MSQTYHARSSHARLSRLGLLAALLVVATACQSTHDRAALARKASPQASSTVLEAPTVTIGENSAIDARVVALLTQESQDGLLSVVVVELTSRDTTRSVVWAPIDVHLLGADGMEITHGNIPGANPLLIHVPSLPAGGTAYYVNDSFNPDSRPASATVDLGGTMQVITPPPGLLDVKATMQDDPTYGPGFTGTITNTTAVRQEQVIVQAIARRGGQIVAAGTAIVTGLDAGASVDFTGSLIGDITGAALDVFAPVSNVSGAAGAPPAAG